jgi:hypothetical protein
MRWFWLVAAAMAVIGPVGVLEAEEPDKAVGTAPVVLVPAAGEKAYTIAGEAFVDLWAKVTGKRLPTAETPTDLARLPAADLVVIGSDSVQPYLHNLIRRGALETLGLVYGTDSYRLLSIKDGDRRCLIVAGGSGRSTLYAVYDFFRRQTGAEYFWDGDRIPRRAEIDYTSLDVLEKPRFEYRGLRYFAHRGLHRFQAEHWDLDDWKREIDWLVKKRLNVFMLRTGIDDLFQRAFPGEVTYPPEDGMDPDSIERSHYDRTSFWPLKYRGELRKAVLEYARDRGLVHPEDTGTMTHWYSPTPSSFYQSHPEFRVVQDHKTNYRPSIHGVWDISTDMAWDGYWRLTATHIREFGGGEPRLFHTIGLAERRFGNSDRENLQLKLYAYRKIQQKLREHYPDVPLLVGSWDFVGWWKDPEVQRLLAEFDPAKTLILDYTADNAEKVTFRDWGLMGRFPWIFGIFHGEARNTDIHGDYSLISERLRMASDDPQCRGMVMWTEISHSDTFLLEYLADNSWQPCRLNAGEAVERFCRTRYSPELAVRMKSVWTSMLEASQSVQWDVRSKGHLAIAEPQFRILSRPLPLGATRDSLGVMVPEYQRLVKGLPGGAMALGALVGLCETCSDDLQWRRDAIDMGRTVANRLLLAMVIRAAILANDWQAGKAEAGPLRDLATINQETLAALADLLALSDDYSMTATLDRLGRAEPLAGVEPRINPHSEQTLKSNAETTYCRSHHYELVRHVFASESQAVWNFVLAQLDEGNRRPWKRPAVFSQRAQEIQDRFYATPLARMASSTAFTPRDLSKALVHLEELVRRFVAQTASEH